MKMVCEINERLPESDLYFIGPNERKIVVDGTMDGRDFVILTNCSGFPVAYISLNDDDHFRRFYDYECEGWEGCLCVHGGVTFCNRCYWDKNSTKWYVGWDYAHSSDWCSFYTNPKGHRWTISEILGDCYNAAKKLRDMNEHPEKYVFKKLDDEEGDDTI